MKAVCLICVVGGLIFTDGIFAAAAQSSNNVAATQPIFVPDMTHANDPMPDGIFAWDSLAKTVDAAADQAEAQFTFNFTNVSPGNVAIMDVHPSCGCTTAQLPSRPWLIAPGTNGQIPITVNIAGKTGTLFKYVDVSTDKGIKRLMFQIVIALPVVPTLTDADRAHGVAMAKVDRQAVFRGDCATCHFPKNAGAKYDQQLYLAVCAICHDANPRATMVPDLHNLKVTTNEDFWRTWIMQGKPGSLMPAFAGSQGGPLTDMQIASLARYLNSINPSRVASPQ